MSHSRPSASTRRRGAAVLGRLARAGRWRSSDARTRGIGWRLITPLVFVGAGALLITSSIDSGGTDLRAGRYENLTDLARQESARVQQLHEQVADLNDDITALAAQVHDSDLSGLRSQIDALKVPAGLTAVRGPGITVTLDDAPPEVRASAGDEEADTIVHQQDIQAVVNALWAGGAEAMTLQGQRVVSTTGIKCVGNTVLLHGVTYSPPYVVSAIGEVDTMQARLRADPYIRGYLEAVDTWRLGWDVEIESLVEAPAFDGPTELRAARPVTE